MTGMTRKRSLLMGGGGDVNSEQTPAERFGDATRTIALSCSLRERFESKPPTFLAELTGLIDLETVQDLILTGLLFRGPVRLQFSRQLRSGRRTKCFLLGLRSGFDWLRCWFSSSQVRQSCFLSYRNFLFCSSAHSPF